MKRKGKSIFIGFIVVGVFAGILVMHLTEGTAVAEKGGFRQCKADLNICEANFQICLETTALISRTGQEVCYLYGDDGDFRYGVTCPYERFTDNLNGTVTDNLTGLIWTTNANCKTGNWYDAVNYCKTLAQGSCDLEDGSFTSAWRLPNAREISSLIDYGNDISPLPPLPPCHPFLDVGSYYWTSTTRARATLNAWYVTMAQDGALYPTGRKIDGIFNVWCVKGGLQME